MNQSILLKAPLFDTEMAIASARVRRSRKNGLTLVAGFGPTGVRTQRDRCQCRVTFLVDLHRPTQAF